MILTLESNIRIKWIRGWYKRGRTVSVVNALPDTEILSIFGVYVESTLRILEQA